MKKFLFILFTVLFLAACDNGTMDDKINPFVGEWEAASGYRDVFTSTTVTVYDTEGNIYWTASYTYDDSNITVIIDTSLSNPEVYESWGTTKQLPYSFESNSVLYLYHVRLERIY